jgi:hypothetical protein
LLLFELNIFCLPFIILFYPETAGRFLEEMDTLKKRENWKISMSSRHIREKGIEDWRWVEKTKEEDYEKLENGRRMSTDQKSPTEDARDARRS